MRRFWDKVDASAGEDACWEWTAVTLRGYGKVWFGGRMQYAHRVAYALEFGSITDGLQIDHLCRTHGCVNPAHLEAVTQRENLLRGRTITARHAAATHCPRSHAYDEANTYVNKGKRYCRTCNRDRAHA